MTLATRAQMLRAGDKARDALGDRYLITASQMHITGSSRGDPISNKESAAMLALGDDISVEFWPVI